MPDPRDLSLELRATTELLRSQLIRADAAVGDFEKNTNQHLQRVDRGFDGLGKSLSTFETRMRSSSATSGQMRSGMQQLSFQLNDVAVQFAAGTNASVIFAQQSGQVVQAIQMMSGGTSRLAGFLGGPWGIALSTATVVLSPFIARLFDTGAAADEAKGKLDALKQSMDRVARGSGTPQDLSGIDLQLRSDRAARGRLQSELTNDPFGTEASRRDAARGLLTTAEKARRARVQAQIDAVNASISKAEALLRGAELQDQARARLDKLNAAPNARAAGGGSGGSGGGGVGRSLEYAAQKAEELSLKLTPISEQFDNILRSDEALSQRTRDFYDSIGVDPWEGVRNFVDQSDRMKDAGRQAADELFRQGQERVQHLASIFESAFSGRAGSFWNQFKRLGLSAVAQIVARLATNNGGQGGGIGSIISSVAASIFSGSGFADGGSPPMGKVSLVGERGPELFVPKVPGTIIPNHMLGGGGSVSLTINAPGATAETVMMIRRELANAAPQIIQAAQRSTLRQATRTRMPS